MVPDAEFTSYYGRSVLKEPTWEARDIAGYLFLGGLAGGSSALAAAADLTGRPRLTVAGRLAGLGAIGLSAVALVHDLGRPERFVNMLRVLKPTSPMSVGSWLLSAYGPLAGAAAASSVTGRYPGLGRAAGIGAGVLGGGVASYTAVLLADTAVPTWHEAYRQLPFLFTGSACAAAGGLGLITAPASESALPRSVAVGGALVELAASQRMESAVGLAKETLHTGRAGRLLRVARAATAAGAVGAATVGRRSRLASALSGAALLAGSAATRFGIFEAGRQSTLDPKYTVVPQRERLAARQNGHAPTITR
jgi:DMSO reductase anchor subunit